MFRRRQRDSASEEVEPDLDLDLDDEDGDGAGPDALTPPDAGQAVEDTALADTSERVGGPWDIEDVPQDGRNRVDLGAMQLPIFEGVDVRVDVDEAADTIVSVTLAAPSSALQLMAFAAPRTTGIWAEVRTEIAASVTGGGGQTQEAAGPFGTELRGFIPTDVPGQFAAARFIGVDGPRWFLRGLVTGAAATDPAADPQLFEAFGEIAVVRGTDAMAVRDALPLRLPKDAVPMPAPGSEPEAAAADPLTLPERGPEITETR